MESLLVVCVAFLLAQQVQCGNIMNEIKSVLQSSKQEFCTIGEDVKVLSCTNAYGETLQMVDEKRIPIKTACSVHQKGNLKSIACLSNGFITDIETSSIVTKRGIQKREWFKDDEDREWYEEEATALFCLPCSVVGHILCVFFCKYEKPNRPPTMRCAELSSSSPVYAPKGKLKATVTWTEATARDPEDGSRRVSWVPESFKSGRSYAEGYYVIAFYASDSKGSGVQCFLHFQVAIRTCSHPGYPNNGELSCDEYFTAYGRGCNVSCHAGYELKSTDATAITCLYSLTWNKVPDCHPVPCKETPDVPNGYIDCPNGAVFSQLCGVVCDEGYSVVGSYFVSCNEVGIWQNDVPKCKDKTPPQFIHCPENIQVDIDSPDNTANVSWSLPEGTDNSNNFTITEINGNDFGRYKAGSHLIHYKIADNSNNIGISCVFMIEVQTISCEPASLNVSGSRYMKYDCPNFYRYGAECFLSCKSGYPLVGVTSIQCLNVGQSDPPVLEWTWDTNGLPPYCKESICSDLSTPDNGALACALWAFGNTCQIQCQDGFDVAFLPSGGGLFVCSTSDGAWIPDNNIPDCIERNIAKSLKMAADFYYYTGECNSSAENIQEIQDNFISALNSSAYKAFCLGADNCHSRFVGVTCGAITGRRRRDDSFERNRRSEGFAYKIIFEFYLSVDEQNVTDGEKRLEDLFDQITQDVSAGQYDVDGLEVTNDSLGIGYPELDCPKGTEARRDTFSCAGCATGRYYNKNTRDCEYCPIGTYQDQPNSNACIQCPENTTTLDVGADICLRYCEPGEYSPTGLAPCGKCPSNSYQPSGRQTSCMLCGSLQRTPVMGASTQDQCAEYDIEMKNGKPIIVRDVNTTSTSLTLATWLFLLNNNSNNMVLSIASADETFSWAVIIANEVLITINSADVQTGIVLSKHKWTHLAITVDSNTKEVDIYINGNIEYTSSSFNITRSVIVDDDNIVMDADIQLSSIHLLPSVLNDSHILELASTCHYVVTDSFLNSDTIVRSTNAKAVVPSKCDAIDDCKDSPCGIHGDCKNKQDGFVCSCIRGYTGTTCQDPPNVCLSHLCQNGASCVIQSTNYTCQCPYGYNGVYCENKAVDGKWSQWSKWSECSDSCGEAVRTRSRACDSPPPDADGLTCTGDSIETSQCETISCPECPKLRRPRGADSVNCRESDVLKRCNITCAQGLFLPSDSPPYYDCGPLTNYTWSHQTVDNPKGRLPTCTEVKPPTGLNLTIKSTYDGLVCQDDVSTTIINESAPKVQSLPCSAAGKCTHTITTNCESGVRKRRSTDTVVVTVTLSSSNLPLDVDFQALFNNQTVGSSLLELLNTITALEESAQMIYNTSTGFFSVNVQGTDYTVSTVEASSAVTCLPGSIRLDSLCVESPIGSYSDGSMLVMCPKGTYQDETSSTSCKNCPSGFTTDEIGTSDITECNVKSEETDEENTENTGKEHKPESKDVTIIMAVAVSVGVIVLIVIAVLVVYKLKIKRTRTTYRYWFVEPPCCPKL